ncbi:MAG: hypothetical protein H7A38_06345 [Chlamydiales bacterium]|nr:hypothetical protein [Chlamydiales bacterium]
MENQTKLVQGSRQATLQAIAEGKPNQEDLFTSMVSLRTSEVLQHLGIHYAHENPLALQMLQEEQEKEEAQKEKEELLYQSLSFEELSGDHATGQEAIFAAAGNLAKVNAKAEKKKELDEQVAQKITGLNIQDLETKEDIIKAFLKYMNSAGDCWYDPEGNWGDFEKLINELKEWFKGNKNAESLLNNIEHTAKNHWNEYGGWGWFGGYRFYNSIFKNKVLPQLESLLEKALEMPSPFQQALEKEMDKLEKADERELAFIQALQIKVAEGAHAKGENAVFESASLVSEVTSDAQESELNNLEKRVKELELELQNLVKMEKLLVMYNNAVQKFQKSHNFSDFFQVLLVLFSEFGKDPGVRSELNKVLKEGIGAFFESKFDGFWWDDSYIWNEFSNTITSTLDGIEKNNIGDPELAGVFLSQGKKAFDKILKQMLKSIDQMEQIIRFIEEDQGENAIFMMEQEIMQMEAVALKSNANQNKIQEKESRINIQNLQQTLTKIQNALKKLEKAQHHHHHGIFGWIEDLVDAIKGLLEKLCNLVKDLCTGNFHAAAKDFNSLGIVKALKSLFSHLAKALKDIEHGNFKAAFSQIKQAAEIAVEAYILTAVLGPAGIMLMGTKFGNDMKDAGTLVMDAVQALGQLVLAGLSEAVGQDSFAKELMKSDKKLGIEMLENPALKPLMDVATIILAVVAAAAGQVEIAALLIGLMILSDTGVMGDVEKGLTKLFEDMGCSKDVAKLLSDITVIVIVTVATLGMGSAEAAGEEAGDALAEEGSEIASNEIEMQVMGQTEEVAEESAEQGTSQVAKTAEKATEEAKNSDSILTKITKAVGKRIGSRAGAALMGFGMSLGMTNLGVDLAKVIDKKDKELQEILMIVQEVVAAVSAVLGGAGVAFGSAATEAAEASEGTLRKAIDDATTQLSEALRNAFGTDAVSMVQLSSQLQRVYLLLQGIYGGMEGGLTMLRGEYEAELAKDKADFQFVEALQQINLNAMKQTTDHRGQLVKEFDQMNDELIKAPGMIAEAHYQVMSQNIV